MPAALTLVRMSVERVAGPGAGFEGGRRIGGDAGLLEELLLNQKTNGLQSTQHAVDPAVLALAPVDQAGVEVSLALPAVRGSEELRQVNDVVGLISLAMLVVADVEGVGRGAAGRAG